MLKEGKRSFDATVSKGKGRRANNCLKAKRKEEQERLQKMLSLQQLTQKNNAAIKIQSAVRGYYGRILARQKNQMLLRKTAN